MPNARPQSPGFTTLVDEIARQIISQGSVSAVLPGFEATHLQVRPHLRQRSPLQRAVQEATRAGLMRRDSRGRFVGLDPRVTKIIARIIAARKKAAQPTRTQIKADQDAVFALLRSIE